MGWRASVHRYSTRLYRPGGGPGLHWIGGTRVAIGGVPTAVTLSRLRAEGVTHIVNCRATLQTWLSQDLALERQVLGARQVVHAPMWDNHGSQPPRRWSRAAHFAADTLQEDLGAGVLIHCQHGRHRSVLVAYATLRLLGHPQDAALTLIRTHHHEADPLPRYTASVERWLAAGAQ
jgi:hypothetical protein